MVGIGAENQPELVRLMSLVMATVLVGVSLLIVYPLVAYARNVAYTEGFVFLALAFFTVTAITLTDIYFAMEVVSDVLRTLGAAFAFAGVWYFSRDFIDVNGTDMSSFGVDFDLGGDDDGDD